MNRNDSGASMWLHEPLDYWSRTDPDAEFAIHAQRAWTYREAAEHVDRLAGALARRLDVGDRFAILSKNSIEMVLLYYAASKAGVVPVPLNYRLAPTEIAYIVGDAGARVIFAQHEFAHAIDAIDDKLPQLEQKVALSSTRFGEWNGLDDWYGAPLDTNAAASRRCGAALQIYTSGTTGLPKGAVLTQPGLASLLVQWSICLPVAHRERMLIVAPLYHVGGSLNAFHAVVHGGAMIVHTDFRADAVVASLADDRIATAFLVPSMIQACLAEPGVDARQYPCFRMLSYGASPIAEGTLRRALDVFGCDFVQSFGMTECPSITYLTADDHRRALAGAPHLLESAGRAGPGSRFKILADWGAEQPPGEIGEILAQGPQLMEGYWGQNEATASALAGGWMHTGDAGYVDEEGYLYIRDRLKDMIVSGAENIYPREIEVVLLQHADVDDVAVIGVPSEKWGETVLAIVVLRSGATAGAEELDDHCRAHLAGYKQPRQYEFVPELPRNPSGKILKRALREPYWAGRERNIG